MPKSKLSRNKIAVFTNLEYLATEFIAGAGLSHDEIIDFFEMVDAGIGDPVFTQKVLERFKQL